MNQRNLIQIGYTCRVVIHFEILNIDIEFEFVSDFEMKNITDEFFQLAK